MWQHLQGEMCIDHKMEHMCRFFVNNLLLHNPDELTWRHAVALVHLCSNIDITASDALGHIAKMRELMVTTRHVNPHGIKGFKSYPEIPDALLRDLHPHTTTWYGDDAPWACPIDVGHLRTVERLIPMRQSHRHAKGTKSPQGSPMKDTPDSINLESYENMKRYIKGHHVTPGAPGWLGCTPKHEAGAR